MSDNKITTMAEWIANFGPEEFTTEDIRFLSECGFPAEIFNIEECTVKKKKSVTYITFQSVKFKLQIRRGNRPSEVFLTVGEGTNQVSYPVTYESSSAMYLIKYLIEEGTISV